ncbi:hypothetical protein CRE_12483 [Caenorhabditis remanei]|uniref:Uncharacterized protein n=1 Tax=Caenorhabditis remanei TaxID=31234 RepID=E3M752_CAERE|nr:hypothetical protein CRE_12483 [Caenorhabditis remanei]
MDGIVNSNFEKYFIWSFSENIRKFLLDLKALTETRKEMQEKGLLTPFQLQDKLSMEEHMKNEIQNCMRRAQVKIDEKKKEEEKMIGQITYRLERKIREMDKLKEEEEYRQQVEERYEARMKKEKEAMEMQSLAEIWSKEESGHKEEGTISEKKETTSSKNKKNGKKNKKGKSEESGSSGSEEVNELKIEELSL